MIAEEFFLRYAFPCANVLVQNKTMTQERYNELEQSLITKEFPSRNIIENSFPAAFRRIKKISHELGIEDYWNMNVLKEYWHNYHNKIIEEKDGNYSKFPESFCDFCKVHVAEIIEKLPQGFLLVEYENKKRPVSGEFIENAQLGNYVRIHHAYAVEKVD